MGSRELLGGGKRSGVCIPRLHLLTQNAPSHAHEIPIPAPAIPLAARLSKKGLCAIMIADWVTLSPWINPLTRKPAPTFPRFHPCQFQRRDLFSRLKIPLFISIRRDRTQDMNPQNLSSKLFVCLAVYSAVYSPQEPSPATPPRPTQRA